MPLSNDPDTAMFQVIVVQFALIPLGTFVLCAVAPKAALAYLFYMVLIGSWAHPLLIRAGVKERSQ